MKLSEGWDRFNQAPDHIKATIIAAVIFVPAIVVGVVFGS